MSQPQLTMGYANGQRTPLTEEELTQCRTISKSLRIVQSTHEGQVVPACGNICIHVESETQDSIDAFVSMNSIAIRINGELYYCRYKLTQAIPAVGTGAFGQLLSRLHQIPDPNW